MIERTLATVTTPIAPNFDWDEFDAAMARAGLTIPSQTPIEHEPQAAVRIDRPYRT
jgi:hypothetical protein